VRGKRNIRPEENKLDPAELNTKETKLPAVQARQVWRTIRGFILWSHERGTIQYDVMVTLILLFVFLSPFFINFKDRPVQRNPHSSGVAVYPDGSGGFVYQVEGKAIEDGDDAGIRTQLLRIIEPISGGVSITRYEILKDNKGHVVAYKAWVQR